jgi:hypothetical protein
MLFGVEADLQPNEVVNVISMPSIEQENIWRGFGRVQTLEKGAPSSNAMATSSSQSAGVLKRT